MLTLNINPSVDSTQFTATSSFRFVRLPLLRCSCKAIERNYTFMFAWALMNEKLFIITFFS